MKKTLLTGLLAVALAVSAGIYSTGVSAQQPSRTFSVAAHFEYEDGFSFDYILERGVAPSKVHERLADCGQSHWTRSVVRYHCFVIPE
jgi:hypothetical protein